LLLSLSLLRNRRLPPRTADEAEVDTAIHPKHRYFMVVQLMFYERLAGWRGKEEKFKILRPTKM
jgi:hypothetical protein